MTPCHRFAIAALAAVLAAATPAAATPAATTEATPDASDGLVPIRDFVSDDRFGEIKLSPDGRYLAMTAAIAGKDSLVVLDRASLEVVNVNQMPGEQGVGLFWWVGPERLAFTPVIRLGSFASPIPTGEYYAVNADGSQAWHFGGRTAGVGQATARGRRMDSNQALVMVDPMHDDPRSVLMRLESFGSQDGRPSEIVRVDTFTGARAPVMRGPSAGCEFVLEADRAVRFANCGLPDRSSRVYEREAEGGWTLVNDSAAGDTRLRIVAPAPDGRWFARVDDQRAPASVGLFDPDDGAFEAIWNDGTVDPDGFIATFDGRGVIGVLAQPGRPRVTLVDDAHPDAAIYLAMAEGFPGQLVQPINATSDGRLVLFLVSSPTNPGELYLFDRASGQARFALRRRESLAGHALAEVRPIQLQASDGMRLHGYLTIPPGRALEGLPLVVNPHGGPHGPRDRWGYSRDTQVLASRGYLVLQVNFRGSGGYGQAFEEAGYGEWGGRIMDDINEAARHVIAQGWADGGRVCIYGGSFGGYSSMMAPIRDPGLYKCSIPVVGMSDLSMMYDHGDIPQRRAGVAYLEEVIGRDRGRLAAFSPLQRVDEFDIPVFLIHGRQDRRVPIIQSEVFRDALEARGREVEWLVKDDEGHGFFGPENLEEQYTRMFAFLQRHIGPGTTPRVTVGDGEQVTLAD